MVSATTVVLAPARSIRVFVGSVAVMTRKTCRASSSVSPRPAANLADSAMRSWVDLLISRLMSMRRGPSGPKNAGIRGAS